MTQLCHKKCIFSNASAEMQVGELSCLDRCVGKYMGAAQKIDLVYTTFMTQTQQQMQAQQELQNQMGAGRK